MSKYAAKTEVGSDRSRLEIEKTLKRYGATRFVYASEDHQAIIGFEMKDRRVMFSLPLPDPNAKAFTLTDTGRDRAPKARAEAYEQAIRQRWRALALVVKAKLEAVDSGITSFENEFLAHIVLPSGQTIGQQLIPQLGEACRTGNLPALLPSGR